MPYSRMRMTDVEDSALMDGVDAKWRSLTSSDITCRFFSTAVMTVSRTARSLLFVTCH